MADFQKKCGNVLAGAAAGAAAGKKIGGAIGALGGPVNAYVGYKVGGTVGCLAGLFSDQRTNAWNKNEFDVKKEKNVCCVYVENVQ